MHGNNGTKGREIRRSLRTRDRDKAIVLAQVMHWRVVKSDSLMTDDKNKQMEEMDRFFEEEEKKYHLGKAVYNRDAIKVNLNNPYDLDNLRLILTDYEMKCLFFYLETQEYYEEKPVEQVSDETKHKSENWNLKNRHKLEKLLLKFLKEKKGTTAKSTMKAYTLIAKRFLRIVFELGDGNRYIENIESDAIRNYREAIIKFPSKKEWKDGVSLDEFMSGEHNTISQKTIKQHFSLIRSFFDNVPSRGVKCVFPAGVSRFRSPRF